MNRVLVRGFCVRLLLALSLSGLLPSLLHAAGDSSYSAEVPVNSQSDEDRSAGLRLALGQVIARLSGDPGSSTRADVAKALAQAANYVQQYQYLRSSEGGTDGPAHLLLSAQFDPAAVDELLRRLHLGTGASETADVVPEQGGTLRVWISGLHSASDYARAMAALLGSDNVTAATPQQGRADGLLVVLKLRSGVARLLENLAAAQTLSPLSDRQAPIDGVDLQLAFHP